MDPRPSSQNRTQPRRPTRSAASRSPGPSAWIRRWIAGLFRFLLRLAILCAAAAAFLHWSNTALQVTRWNAVLPNLPEGFDGCRIVILADLHGAEFGAENRRLFRTVRAQNPDYIFYLGDLEDRYRGSVPGYAEEVSEGLSAIAPSFYITGNHEWGIGDVPKLKERIAESGMTVLSNAWVTLERGGGVIVLAGLDDPNGRADQKTPEAMAEELRSACGEDAFWILLAHRNNVFAPRYSLLGADLTFSGHGHGGLIRLPFTDGIFSVERTFFPSWTSGFYEANDSLLFVTRGLGNSGKTFRLFNRPEIAVVTLRRPPS